MANVLGTLFQDIANAIREKTGGTGTMKPAEFPTQIAAIPTGGGSSADVRYVTFVGADGAVLYKKPVAVGDDCVDVLAKGLISTPTKESTVAEVYTYSGWSLAEGGAASSTALKNVTEDRTVYAAFTSAARKYTARFYDDAGALMQESQVAYGTKATPPDTARTGYTFNGWTPSDLTIRGDTDFVGEWEVYQGWLIKEAAPTPNNITGIRNIIFSHDDTRAFLDIENTLTMYDTTTAPWTELLAQTYPNHPSAMVKNLLLSSDGLLLIVAVNHYITDEQFGIYMYAVGENSLTQLDDRFAMYINYKNEQIRSIALSPDETKLAVAFNRSPKVVIYDIASGQSLKVITRSSGTSYIEGRVMFSPDGTKLIDIADSSSKPINVYDVENDYVDVASAYFTDAAIGGFGIAYTPDGRYLAIASNGSNLVLLDTSTTPYTRIEVDLSQYSASNTRVRSVAFSSDGSLLAFSPENSPYIGVLDMATKTLKEKPFILPTSYGNCIAFDHGINRLVIGHSFAQNSATLYEIRR